MAAAPEVAEGLAGGTASQPGVSRGRLLAAGGLFGLVVMAAGLRIAAIVLVPSINWGDEIFQTVEPAHRLVFGYGLVAWEFQVGMRSWLLSGLVAGLIEASRLFGDGPQYYLAAIAAGLALLACAPVVCVFLWARRAFGLAGAVVAAAAVAVAPELVYFGGRTLNEVVAAHVLVIACYLIVPADPSGGRRRLVVAGGLLGVVCLLRLQLAPAALLLALWPGLPGWRGRLPALIAGGLAALACGAAFDWLTLGYPLASVWRNLYYNLYLGISSGFSVEPWYFYLLGELGIWLTAAPLLLFLVVLGARRMPVLAAAAVVIVAVHSAIGHKEYRFIYPAIVLAMVLAALGLAQVASWVEQWLRGRGAARGAAMAAATALTLACWGAASASVWSGPTLGALRQRAHDELTAMSYVRTLPGLCGVGLYGKNAWVRYGGYTYLHRPVPLYWPKDRAELNATAGAFDALLYDRQPAAPQLGFTTERCFGKICVARRPGPCDKRPMAGMWFPEQLRGVAPPPERFDAVPQDVRTKAAR